ncbi:sensor histidine kinase [Parafilimonas terrae]|uniref:Histidine kinase n=1 Tax=Parafilimonas terrae TaxID=1465490 RepID=A0A1I5UXU7_9BACT|nr:histidine kinase [Parafilimonas terrae]SFQ00050.1 Histidine kinase [Parafilimonas terrae]
MTLKAKYKTIIYTAILTTPFIGLFGITPIINPIIMQYSGPPQYPMHPGHPMQIPFRQQNHFIPFLIVTLQVALIWLQNILLLIYGTRLFSVKKSGNAIRFILSYAITAAIALIVRKVIFHPGPFPFPEERNSFEVLMPVISAAATNTIILIIIQLLLIRYSETQVRIENAELKMQHIQAEHEKLLHQLQPHFLFNSLNALKTLIKRNTKEAEDYLVKLSEFLRFSLSHNEHTVVLLQEEMQFSLTYLQMQKTRFGESLFYEMNISENIAAQKKVPVFSLQLLVENCLKHNKFTQEQPLKITIYSEDNYLVVSNNMQSREQAEAPSGVGLANLSQRYKYLAGEDVKIEQTENHFTVYLKLL